MNNQLIKRGVIGLTILVLAVLAWTILNPAKDQGQLVIPESLAKLPRTELITGPQAIEQISRLHQTNIVISQGYIATYGQGNQEVTLWISESPTDAEGQALFAVMDEKMPASKMFTNREELNLKGTKVIKVLGMGQEHYYWVKGKVNFWVAIGGLQPLDVLEEVMTKI